MDFLNYLLIFKPCFVNVMVALDPCYSKYGLWIDGLTSPGSLLEVQNLRTCSKSTDSEYEIGEDHQMVSMNIED